MKMVIRNSRWSGSKNVEVNNELEINLKFSNHICFALIDSLQTKKNTLCFVDQLSLKGHSTTSEPAPQS